jgi:hypothetical protein
MASKKRLNKIANQGGYNYLDNNPHLERKKEKSRLRNTEVERIREVLASGNCTRGCGSPGEIQKERT